MIEGGVESSLGSGTQKQGIKIIWECKKIHTKTRTQEHSPVRTDGGRGIIRVNHLVGRGHGAHRLKAGAADGSTGCQSSKGAEHVERCCKC